MLGGYNNFYSLDNELNQIDSQCDKSLQYLKTKPGYIAKSKSNNTIKVRETFLVTFIIFITQTNYIIF